MDIPSTSLTTLHFVKSAFFPLFKIILQIMYVYAALLKNERKYYR